MIFKKIILGFAFVCANLNSSEKSPKNELEQKKSIEEIESHRMNLIKKQQLVQILNKIEDLFEENKKFSEFKTLIDLYLSAGGNIDDRNLYGDTLLHTASFLNRSSVAQYLILNGASIEATIRRHGQDNCTPLMAAAMMDSKAVIKVLLHYGANVTAKTSSNLTAKEISDHYGHKITSDLLHQEAEKIAEFTMFEEIMEQLGIE